MTEKSKTQEEWRVVWDEAGLIEVFGTRAEAKAYAKEVLNDNDGEDVSGLRIERCLFLKVYNANDIAAGPAELEHVESDPSAGVLAEDPECD